MEPSTLARLLGTFKKCVTPKPVYLVDDAGYRLCSIFNAFGNIVKHIEIDPNTEGMNNTDYENFLKDILIETLNSEHTLRVGSEVRTEVANLLTEIILQQKK